MELFYYRTCFFFQYNVGACIGAVLLQHVLLFYMTLELTLELFYYSTCFFFNITLELTLEYVLLQHVFSQYNARTFTRAGFFFLYNKSIYWSYFVTTRAFFKFNARANTGAIYLRKKIWFLQHNVKPCSEVVLLQHVLFQYNALDYTNLKCHFNGMPVGVCMSCGHSLICLGSYS